MTLSEIVAERDALRERLAQKEQVLEREAAGWSEQVQALRSEVEALNAQTVKIVHAQTVLEKQRDEARAEVERLRESLDNTYSNAAEHDECAQQLQGCPRRG